MAPTLARFRAALVFSFRHQSWLATWMLNPIAQIECRTCDHPCPDNLGKGRMRAARHKPRYQS